MLSMVRGRVARPASWRWNAFKTLLQTVVFWLVFLVVLPAGILALEEMLGLAGWRFSSPASRWVGGLVFALAGLLNLASGAAMAVAGRGTPLPADCPRELVVVGPYRFLRNPMALGGLTQGVGVGLYLGSPAVIAYSVLGGPVWHYLVRPWEELDLEHRFGDAYRHYRAAVRCWLPRFPGYRPSPAVPLEDPKRSPHAFR